MVTLKVRSPEDIIAAYLKSLNFSNNEQLATEILDRFGDVLRNTTDIVACLEDIVAKTADRVFVDNNLLKEQKLAQLKFCFIKNNGAKKWGLMIFEPQELSDDFIDKNKSMQITIAPEYSLSHMEPQVIETIKPKILPKFISKSAKA